MSLRRQLLALGLLTLGLPWAGCQYAREMEGVLRSGLTQSLLASASSIARALDEHEALAGAGQAPDLPERTLYAPALPRAPLLDGYGDDWDPRALEGRRLGPGLEYRLGVHERYLYVLAELSDADTIYASAPGQPPFGDRVVLYLGGTQAPWLLLHTAAPGRLRPVRTTPPEFGPTAETEDRVAGTWVETPDGFAVELRIPLALLAGRFGIGFVDVDRTGPELSARLHSSWRSDETPAQPLKYPAPSLQPAAAPFEQAGWRMRIVDRDGWVLFDGGSVVLPADSAMTNSLAGGLYRWMLGDDQDEELGGYPALENPAGFLADPALRQALTGTAGVRWYREPDAVGTVAAAAVPIRYGGQPQGALILEQGSDVILSLGNTAAARLIGLSTLASLLAALGLLGYATLLSLRVRRLAAAAARALSRHGEIEPSLPGQRAADELGDLARSFSDLLRRVRDYNQYLRSLTGKLAHELRTPLAVAATSIDNIEEEARDPRLAPFLERLREGVARLDRLIRSMSAATALEQAIDNTPSERFPLNAIVTACVDGYRRMHVERTFLLATCETFELDGAPELIAQMLDKLVDNAVEFSASGATITVSLTRSSDGAVLAVANPGPRLPEAMRSQLFESMVSVRDGAAARGHLGLGLYVAALIARCHAAGIDAADLPDGSGVVVRVCFPVSRQPFPASAPVPADGSRRAGTRRSPEPSRGLR